MKERTNNFQDKIGQIYPKNSTYFISNKTKLVNIQDEEWLDEDLEPIRKVLEKLEISSYDDLAFFGLVGTEVVKEGPNIGKETTKET